MQKFRKKTIVIEAMRYTAENVEVIVKWCTAGFIGKTSEGKPIMQIYVIGGAVTACYGDWIIKGIKGEFYVIRNDIFEATYERVEE